MCGGNDMLDARAVTAAMDHFVKLKFPRPKEIKISNVEVEDKAARLSETYDEDLRSLLEYNAICHLPRSGIPRWLHRQADYRPWM